LAKKDQPFHWSKERKRSFNAIKEFTFADVMTYFDPNKEAVSVTDASPLGLSAIMIRNTAGKEDK